jgi:ketosteroid isomerase-like protein
MTMKDGTQNLKDLKALALEYLDAVGKKELDRLDSLLAPDLAFRGPSMTRSTARDFVGALARLGAIHVRNDVRRVFVDGDDVCVIYDFVTDTPAGTLPMIEWLHFRDGRIGAIDLYYDRVPWKTAQEEIAARAARAAS